MPFFKKMFVTADNKLLTCERISLHHVLGTVDNEVHLNFGEIASIYNSYYEKNEISVPGMLFNRELW